MRSIAQVLAPYKVRVNSIAPGVGDPEGAPRGGPPGALLELGRGQGFRQKDGRAPDPREAGEILLDLSMCPDQTD